MKRTIRTEELLDEIENANNGEGPNPIATITDPALIEVYKALLGIKAAENRLDTAVQHARTAGCSWQAIGDIIGMTRQGAMKRFAA